MIDAFDSIDKTEHTSYEQRKGIERSDFMIEDGGALKKSGSVETETRASHKQDHKFKKGGRLARWELHYEAYRRRARW